MNRHLQSKPSGYTTILMLLVILILFLIGGGLLNLGLQGRLTAIRDTSQTMARCAADAGLTKAIFEMNAKLKAKDWDDSILPVATDEILQGCDATFSYAVSKDSNNVYSVQSIGKTGQTVETVGCILRLKSIFEHALLVAETLNVKNNNLISGYNSVTGETDLEVQIGTLGTASKSVILGSGIVTGNVIVGVGGDPETIIDADGTITGTKYAITEEYLLPQITAPVLPDMGTINVSGTTVISPAKNGKYTAITASTNGDILEIDGGDVVLHITGNIDMSNFSEIKIIDGSTLTLYVDGNITFTNGAGINNPSDHPADFKLYATGEGPQTFELKNNSDVFGVIYAPNADIIFKNNARLNGSIVSKSLTMMNNSTFYYDEALRDASVDEEAARFAIERWFEQ